MLLVCLSLSFSISTVFFCIFLFFKRNMKTRALDLIREGIALKKNLGVPLYLAAGFWDRGSKYHGAFQPHYFLSTLFVFTSPEI